MLKWARANGCPWDEETRGRSEQWALRGAEVGARERLPVGRGDVLGTREGRPPRGAQVGARERVPVGRGTCSRATDGGHLEVLKWARENGCPWNERTCASAAEGGHSRCSRARENGCPWNEWTCARAESGHLEVLKWTRGTLPVERGDVQGRSGQWAPRGAEMGARERLPVGQVDVLLRGEGGHLEVLKWARANGCPGTRDVRGRSGRWALRGAEVGARERLPVGRGDVLERGEGRPPRGAQVGARGLPVGRGHVLEGRAAPRGAEMGARERARGTSTCRPRRRAATSRCSSGRARRVPVDEWT